ncbi:MAG: cyclodeaminase/cyclohydrolase family protein [Eubacteriaceae bacterium]|nr:cyclodeaminase/cyclohydrolase family protein [Eubacteriaceae bacterium]
MGYSQLQVDKFVDASWSKDPVPGGGGCAALYGAIGAALAGMVGNLTTGKKKYAEFEDDIQVIIKKTDDLSKRLVAMIDQDAENFLPLSKAYGLPTSTPEEKAAKAVQLEECLKLACSVPIDIVRTCCEAVSIHEELLTKGSSLAMSDVGVGIQGLRAGMICGWLNVLININSMKDKEYADSVRTEMTALLEEYVPKCDEIYAAVVEKL